MIIKSSRIPVGRARAMAAYLTDHGDNEAVKWRRGRPEDINWMSLAAETSGQVFAVRHVIIAPEFELSSTDLRHAVLAITREYRLSDLSLSQVCVVEHLKARSGLETGAAHFHLALPEYDLDTNRVLDSRFTRMRDEKLARMLELQLGHSAGVGRFNREIYRVLKQDHAGIDLAPFQNALEHASAAAGHSEKDWLLFRARARQFCRSPSHPRPHYNVLSRTQDHVTDPLSKMGDNGSALTADATSSPSSAFH